ncbi:MAG: hypothetical protein ACOC5C_02110 [Halobacteriota archaeon]
MKRVLVIATLFLLTMLLAVHPVLGLERLNATDFKDPDITLSIDGVDEKPYFKDNRFLLDKVLEGGDSVKINYPVKPIDEDSAKNAVDRTYTVKTDLRNGIIEASLYYRKGGGQGFESTPGKNYLDVKVSDWDEGLSEINCTIQGEAPQPSARLQEIRAIYFDVQVAEDDCLPPLVLMVVDYNKFQSDINSMKKEYNNLTSILDEYSGKTDTGELDTCLDRAHQNLSVGESYYTEGDYQRADEKLNNVEEWLSKAVDAVEEVEAEYAYQQADRKLDSIGSTLDKIELYLEEVEMRDKLNTSTLLDYKSEFKGMQQTATTLKEELASAEGYINNQNYGNAKAKAENVLNGSESVEQEANSLLEDLKSVIHIEEDTIASAQPTATPTATTEENEEATAFTMPSIDFKWVAIAIGLAVILGGAGIGTRKYIRRRRWDELK